MGISFDKRKLKIKIIEQKEQVQEKEINEKTFTSIPKQKDKIDKSVLKINQTFKGQLKEIEKHSTTELNLSDFTIYQYFFDNRYQFQKISGGIFLTEITLEKYLSMSKLTVIRRATGLAEAKEYRSRLVMLCHFEDKDYILVWSSILYEAFDDEVITKLKALLAEMRDKQ